MLFSQAGVQDLLRELFGRLPERLLGVGIGPYLGARPVAYARGQSVWGEAALVAMACVHQRLGWTHPFMDGNGSVMRLHTHTLLSAQGYTNGLWPPLRGFARGQDRFRLAG